jgi:hypothetical protein
VGQQAGLPRPVEQARQAGFRLAFQLGQGMVAFAHSLEGVHIHGALEQVQQGDEGLFVGLEGVAEAVVERGARGFVTALFLIGVFNRLLAAADGFDEGLDWLLAVQAHADGLACDHPQGQGVALAVVEQRLPGGDGLAGDLLVAAEAAGQVGGVAVAHTGHLDPVGQAAQPGLFVAPAGQQDFGLAGPIQLDLLQEVG